MRSILTCAAVLLATSAVAQDHKPLSIPESSVTQPLSAADRERIGDILLYRWTKCQTAAAKKLVKSTLPTEAIPLAAAKACGQDRENWIESQTGGGLTRSMVEAVADSTEHCLFGITTDYVDLVRAGATDADIKEWAARRPKGCKR